MTFPIYGILDDFNRANEGPPPSANWTVPTSPGQSGLGVVNNQAELIASDFNPLLAYWNIITFATTEVYISIPTLPPDLSTIYLYARVDNVGAAIDYNWTGYALGFDRNDAGNDTLNLYRIDTGWSGETLLVSYNQEMTTGDSIGLYLSETNIAIYHKTSLGSWTLIGATTDTAYAIGYIGTGLYSSDGSGALDNFGGGGFITAGGAATGTTPMRCITDPILRFSNGTDIVDILTPHSGWKMASSYWNPQIAQYKSGGIKVNSALAEGQRLVHKEYDNVVETIPLVLNGTDQDRALKTLSALLSLARQSADYWAETYEFDDVWMQVQVAGPSCYSGYARIVQMRIPELTNPFGQPFFSTFNEVVMEGISLIVEREPLWRAVPPGEIIGPLYNLLKNSDFELWNNGAADSQPDSWTDIETIQITGTNNRQDTGVHSGNYALRIRVSGSTLTGRIKGVSQVIANIQASQTYTIVAWIRSDGVSNGVGRLLVTYSGQLEVYRSSTQHGWTLYTGTFTVGANDVVGINCEILSTATNTSGTVYFDSLMLLEGDWEQEAIDGVLPYLSGSHIVNHWDQPENAIVEAGDLNYVDVWDVPGNDNALVRLEVRNNNTIAETSNPVEVISKIRIGMRRLGNVFNFVNYFDPAGKSDTTASGDDRVEFTPNNTFRDVATKQITGVDLTQGTLGRYRVIARVYDAKSSGNPTLKARLQYWFGATNTSQVKSLQSVILPVRAQWTTVNLTENAALNFDTKFTPQQPGSLNFGLQYMRDTGSGDGYLDYIILMPTDGGYLEATVNPAIVPGEALVVDTTGIQQSVNVNGLQVGYTTQFDLAAAEFLEPRSIFRDYKGNLYVGTFAVGGNTGNIYRRVGNTWTSVKSSANQDSRSLEVYDGKLYAGGTFDAVDKLIATTDGIVWSNMTTTVETIFVLKSFNGFLWAAIYDSIGTQGYVYRWNGSTMALSFSIGARIPFDMAVYDNRLYLTASNSGAETGRLYVYDPTTNAWSLVTTLGGAVTQDATSLEVFKGKLYVGSGDNGEIFSYDGSTLTKVYDPGLPNVYIGDLFTFNNLLYATVTNSGDGKIIFTEDGTTWNTIYANSSFSDMFAMYGYDGTIYVAVSDAVIGQSIFSIVVNESAQYGVTEYQLTPFESPPKKRHRFFFNWDRQNFINNVDDKALVGIGFVPRYLALRGRF